MAHNYAASSLQDVVNQLYDSVGLSLNLFAREKDWVDILQYRDWTFLKDLDLKFCCISETNVDHLLGGEWPELQRMCLSRNKLSKIGIDKILNKSWFSLKRLSLWRNSLSEGANNLWTKYFHNLQEIQLDYNNITVVGLISIPDCPSKTIKKLCLSNNKIGCKGLKYLIKSDFPDMQTLQVENCEVGTEGMKYLVKSRWPLLKKLNICMNKVTFDGFSSSNNWKSLQMFIFSERRKNYKISYLLISPIYWRSLLKVGQKGQDRYFGEFGKDINMVLQKQKI